MKSTYFHMLALGTMCFACLMAHVTNAATVAYSSGVSPVGDDAALLPAVTTDPANGPTELGDDYVLNTSNFLSLESLTVRGLVTSPGVHVIFTIRDESGGFVEDFGAYLTGTFAHQVTVNPPVVIPPSGFLTVKIDGALDPNGQFLWFLTRAVDVGGNDATILWENSGTVSADESTCNGGPNAGAACTSDADCAGATCAPALQLSGMCDGGPLDGLPCSTDADCAGSTCVVLGGILAFQLEGTEVSITDCNGNQVDDSVDIANGTSQDCNANGVPDECELTGNDCNSDGIPDDCQLAGNDCNTNSEPDECDISSGTSNDANGNGIPDECEADCNGNDVPDDVDIANGTSQDCNANGIPDECDIAGGASNDLNGNSIPDDCEQFGFFRAGDDDNFASTGDPDDYIYVRPVLDTWLNGPGSPNYANHEALSRPFDDTTPHWDFGYTFDGMPQICTGSLRIRVKCIDSGCGDDMLYLQYIDPTGRGAYYFWEYSIADLDALAGGDGSWQVGDTLDYTLDLSQLPDPAGGTPLNLLPAISDAGYLDVVIIDSTGVDFLEISYDACGCVSAPPGMVAWWTGDGCWPTDTLGNHDGFYHGTPICSIDYKVGGGALEFHNDTYVEVQDHPSLDPGDGDFSVDLWFKTAATTNQPMLTKHDAAGIGWQLYILANGQIEFSANTGVCTSPVPTLYPPGYNNNAWHHLAVTVQGFGTGRFASLYVDGILSSADLLGCTGTGIIESNENLLIGGDANTGVEFLGQMDEIEIFDRALLPTEVLGLFAAGSAGKCRPACVVPPDDMVAWWDGDDCGAQDRLGVYDGFFEGSPVCPKQSKVGGGAMFMAPGTYIRVPHGESLDPGVGELTIDAWVLSSANGSQPIVDKLDSIGGYSLSLENDTVVFEVCAGPSCKTTTGYCPANDGKWHHVAATLHRGPLNWVRTRVFVDGWPCSKPDEEWFQFTPPSPGDVKSTSELTIGAAPSTGTPIVFFTGVIDEVEIFDRALTPSEIQELVNAQDQGKCKTDCLAPPAQMAAWWPLDQATASSTYDIVTGLRAAKYGSPNTTSGKVDHAMHFDESTDYLEVDPNPTLTIGDFSIDAWVYWEPPELGDANDEIVGTDSVRFRLVHDGTADHNASLLLWLVNGGVDVKCTGFNESVPPYQWVHVAATYDTFDCALYTNGQEVYRSYVGPSYVFSNNGKTFMGRATTDNAHLKGNLDEVEIFDRALDPSEVQSLYETGSAGKCKCAEPRPGMVAWWNGEDCGETDVLDRHDGEPLSPSSGTCPGSWKVGGPPNYAINFGSNAFRVKDHADLEIGDGEITIDAWIKTDATGIQPIADKYIGGIGYKFYMTNGIVSFQACDGPGTCVYAESPTPINDNHWHMVAARLKRVDDNAVASVWVDGATRKSGTAALGSVDANVDLLIGAGPATNPTEFFAGIMDEIEVYARALTDDELYRIFAADTRGKCPVPRCTYSPPQPWYANHFCVDGSNGVDYSSRCFADADCSNGPCVNWSRYISFLPGSVHEDVGFEVELNDLDGFADANGSRLWVGPPKEYPDEDSSDPGRTFWAAPLQCEPHYQDWSGIDALHVFGAEILPNSAYVVRAYYPDCYPSDPTVSSLPGFTVTHTGHWGDVTSPYSEPGGSSQPDFTDINALVEKFLATPGAPAKAAAQLQPNLVNPNQPINFADISADVDAFLGVTYGSEFTGPCTCPSSVTCGATACTSDANCSGGLCVGGFCADACGRCAP